jgi:phage gp46-like protein
MASPIVDIQLAYDPVNRRCDVVFNGRDFALDATPASAMVMSLFADRRAAPDDNIADAVPDWANPSSLVARRGWCGDFLSAAGGLVGSRLWLLGRRKTSEVTRQDAARYAAEAVAWLETARNLTAQVAADYIAQFATPTLGIRVRVGNTQVTLRRAMG